VLSEPLAPLEYVVVDKPAERMHTKAVPLSKASMSSSVLQVEEFRNIVSRVEHGSPPGRTAGILRLDCDQFSEGMLIKSGILQLSTMLNLHDEHDTSNVYSSS
jgi:hypothetical protein